jgi:HAD superfamily hydrolase (TIGR01509 family)
MNDYNVIFDMDGVIFDSERALYDCWVEVARERGYDLDLVRETYVKCIGTNNNQTTQIYEDAFLPILGPEGCRDFWDESNSLHKERYKDGLFPIKSGVKEILEYLHGASIKIGIASSSRKETVERQIGVAGLSHYFDGIVGGDAVKISKPNPEIYLLACNEFGFEPGETFAIEDSFNGIRAAKAAGMRPIMVPDMIAPDDEMKSLSEYICEDLYGVEEYLKKL